MQTAESVLCAIDCFAPEFSFAFVLNIVSFLNIEPINLAKKWNRAYSDTCGYIKGRLGLTIIRATTRCLYGSRVPARHVSTAPIWSDGLGLGLWTTMSDPPFSGIPPSAVRRAEA